MSRKWIIAPLVGLSLLLGAHQYGAFARKKPDDVAKPALWQLSDKDTTIYLFGTIHMLPKGVAWRSPKLEAAMAKSDTLVLEVAGLEDKAKSGRALLAVAFTPGLPKLVDRVPADKREALTKLAEGSGMPLAFLDTMEDWAAAISMAAGSLKELDLDPENGAEEQLRRTFVAANKPVAGLETVEQQFGFFDTLSPEAQKTLLLSTINESGNVRAEFDKMIAAWRRGDEKAIAISFDDELQLSPELLDALLRKRNANWSQWIDDRMDQPGTLFIGVGAGHLAGKDSVQAMLKKRGFKVKRVQ